MKKNYFKLLITVLFIVLICFCFVKYLRRGHIAKYKIKNKYTFNIVETRTRNEKNELDNYLIEIDVNNTKFTYELFDNFNSKHKIVSDVFYYRDKDYICVYPVLYGDYKTDVKCLHDGIYYYYNSLKGQNKKLDQFVVSIKDYSSKNYLDKAKGKKNKSNITLYNDNLVADHIVAITNLKGLYVIDNEFKNENIFANEIYNRPISVITSDYYLTADYEAKHQFTNFYLYDIEANKKYTIKSEKPISFNSYIEGIVGNYIYIWDITNEKQYKISLSSKSISEVDNKDNKVTYYQNNEWMEVSKVKANNILYFDMYEQNSAFADYDYVYKHGNKESGFYYLYKLNEDNTYSIYRTPVQDINAIEYLFSIDNINTLKYVDDYVYFVKDSSIYYYHQTSGIRKVLTYDELEFNEKILYGVIKK